MSEDSIFINAIRNVREQDELVFFELGEDFPVKNNMGKSTAIKIVMQKKTIIGMTEYLQNILLSKPTKSSGFISDNENIKENKTDKHTRRTKINPT